MSRTPLLTTLLWTSVGVATLAACSNDAAPIFDAASIDSAVDAEVGAIARYATTVDTTATCGVVMPDTVELTVFNDGNAPLTISAATATGGFTVTTTLPLEIAPGASGALTVRPPAAVVGTDRGGTSKTGLLTFTTNTAVQGAAVTLTSVVQGANLSFENSAGEAITGVNLTVASGCPAPQAVFIRNTGNLEAQVTNVSASGTFSVGQLSPSSTVAPGSTINHDVGPFTFSACSGTSMVTYQVTGTVCTATPLTLTTTLNVTGQSSCFCS